MHKFLILEKVPSILTKHKSGKIKNQVGKISQLSFQIVFKVQEIKLDFLK